MKINGWRRLAIILSSIWFLGSISLAVYENLNHQDGLFVGIRLPTGTVVSGTKAILPNGKIIDLDTVINGKTIKPWEIKWDNEPAVPTEKFIRWLKFLTIGFALPFGLWVMFEIMVFMGNWVLRGFRN